MLSVVGNEPEYLIAILQPSASMQRPYTLRMHLSDKADLSVLHHQPDS